MIKSFCTALGNMIIVEIVQAEYFCQITIFDKKDTNRIQIKYTTTEDGTETKRLPSWIAVG